MALGDLVDPPVFNDGEVFIRGFKEGTTKVRFCPSVGQKHKGQGENAKLVTVYGTEAWPSELEHYARGIGYFPCVTPHGGVCGGCADPDERIRKRSRSWFTNALDDNGVCRVFRMGVTLHNLFQAREQRHPGGPQAQPLSKRDYLIHHIGTGLESKYDPEADPDGLYDIDFNTVVLHDIPKVLEGLAEKARLAYAGDTEEPEVQLGPNQTKPAPVTTTRITAKDEASSMGQLDEFKGWGDKPTAEMIKASDTATIRRWLGDHEVEYPPRANRAMLVRMALAEVGLEED